jgi:hypothetical protein
VSHQPFDTEISVHDVQSVHNADALTAFFSKLGYDTSIRTVQTAANLSLSESVARPVKRIELIAGEPNRLQIYFFELRSVTIAEIRSLARAFRTFSGRFLFVLTADFEQLDFVLLDPEMPATTGTTGLSTPQVSLNPRRLSVDRKKPDRVLLRVLRRFTWTEPTAFDQFEKLRHAYDLAHWSEEHFNNRGLFSDYFLTERLRPKDAGPTEFPEWGEDPKPAYQRLRVLYDHAGARFAGKRISELCNLLYEPVLGELGFSVTRTTSAEAGFHLRLSDPTDPQKLLAICLPYPWGRELDHKDDTRDAETPEVTPTFAVVDLLAQHNAPWVVLTNGKLWRLYSKRAHSRATNYYEMDADEVLGRQGFHQDIQDAFRFFWLLFRMQAFRPEERERQGKKVQLNMLDRLLLGSEDYAKQLGESLKSRVFEDVFPELAEGFIVYGRERRGRDAEISEDTLQSTFQGTLTLLYRLLFLLYAESRDLLPLRTSREYFDASLTSLKKQIAGVAGTIKDETEGKIKEGYRADSFALWERLKRLFAVVDQGSEDLNVPRYNGGLFQARRDPADHSPEAQAARFLEVEQVADRHLARAIDLLSRGIDPKRQDLVMIDYKSLGVRQLGSIYEGLLEFRLRIAGEKLAVVKEKGREVYEPFRELGERERDRAERQGKIVRTGRVYLENDKRERKATGSYYTPDHIVKYIVEHAVGPVLKEKLEGLRPKLREAQRERREFFKQEEQFRERHMRPKPVQQADLIGRELVDEMFDIKVLDPAMGSGHFLVEAVDFITDETIKFLSAFPWNPVQQHLNQMRETIRRQMDAQGIEIDANRLDDTNLLKRHVLKRCIYGVDLNPMAVELAKVSLWLDCFTLGAPLSFLDHHLRSGNSLIGSAMEDVDKIRREKGQLPLTMSSDWAGLTQAVQGMISVGGMPDITAAQVEESKQQFESALGGLDAFKRVLNLHTARWFVKSEEPSGKRGKRSSLFDDMLRSGELFDWAHGRVPTPLGGTAESGIANRAVKQAATSAQDNRFFHWELEFPEVFYGRRPGTQNAVQRLDKAGFDAVVGNPPYVRIQTLTDEFAGYLSSRFASAVGKFDIYLPFIERAFLLAAPGGMLGFINPNKFLTADYGSGIRRFIADRRCLRELVDFEDRQVFEGISTYACLLFLQSKQLEFVETRWADPSNITTAVTSSCQEGDLTATPWSLKKGASAPSSDIPLLGEVCESIFQGLITGADPLLIGQVSGDRAIFDGDEFKYESGILRPLLRGKDVRRYALKSPGSYVIYPYRTLEGRDELMSEKFLSECFPETYSYLRRHKSELSERGSDSMQYEEWYALWCPRPLRRFASPKILTQVLALRSTFTLDPAGSQWFTGGGNAGVYGIIPGREVEILYLLGVLNSKKFDEILQSSSSRFRGGYFSYAKRFIERVPIPMPSREVQQELAKLVARRLQAPDGPTASALEAQIEAAVAELYLK